MVKRIEGLSNTVRGKAAVIRRGAQQGNGNTTMSWIFYVTHTSTFLQRRRARSSSSHFGAFLNERSLFSLLLSTHPFCHPASSTRLPRGWNRAISAPCTATPRALPLLQCLKLLPSSPPTVTMSLNPPSCLNQHTAKLKTHRRSSAAR